MNLNNMPKPFLLKPVGKERIWGGSRLNDDFAKNINIENLGETWECSTHIQGKSIVAEGQFKDMDLSEVLKLHPEYLGTRNYREDGQIPVIVKLIDAKSDLSVQVHPTDDYAYKNENGENGKTEMWYVLDAKKDSELVYGFCRDMTRESLEKSLYNGNINKHLRRVKVKKDDLFFIQPGTVHAIGAGVLIVEVQQSSDITYRLYDYDRIDKNGKKRELHIKKAIDVVNLKGNAAPRQPMRILSYRNSTASELLCQCRYFKVVRYIVNTVHRGLLPEFKIGNLSFEILFCTKGVGTVFMDDGDSILFYKGDCIFVPAGSIDFKIHGSAEFLRINC